MPPHPSAIRGSRMLQGRIWGSRMLQDVLWCRHLGQGCQGQGQGQGQGGFPHPPGTAQPPPPLPPWAGRAGTGARQCGTRGQGSAWGRPTAAPLAAQGCSSPSADPRGGGGGLLSLGFTRQVQSSGGGRGRPTHYSRTCTCGRGWGSAQPEIWAGSLLGGSHIGWRPRSFRRAAIRWGGRGVRALYICVRMYIDELSPANPLIPSIALASRT